MWRPALVSLLILLSGKCGIYVWGLFWAAVLCLLVGKSACIRTRAHLAKFGFTLDCHACTALGHYEQRGWFRHTVVPS